MKRREFITLLGGAAATWPLAARAQQPERVRRIAMLIPFPESDADSQVRIRVFEQTLQQLGWTAGRNVRIDIGWGQDVEAMQRLATQLVALQPDLIVSQSTPSTAALLQQTRSIPIVFVQVTDPVGSSFVASIPRPGGNVTGFITMEQVMAGKWLELLKEIAPRVNRVAILFNPATATYAENYLNPFKAAAATLAVEAIVAPARGPSELERGHCRTGTRAEWGSCRDAGSIHGGESRGGHVAHGSLPSPCHLGVPFLHRTRRPAVLRK